MSEQTSKTISLKEIAPPTWPDQCQDEIEAILARYPEGREMSAILPLLHLSMREREGRYVAVSDMQAIAEILGVSPAYVDSVCSFYAMFHRHPVGKYLITVCGSMGCHLLNGGRQLVEHMEQTLGIRHGETTADGLITLEVTPECLAACDLAPVMHVNVEYAVKMTPEKFDRLVEALRSGKGPDAFLEKVPLMSGRDQGEWEGFRPAQTDSPTGRTGASAVEDGAESVAEPEAQAQPETAAEPEAQAQPESVAKPEAQAQPETNSEQAPESK